MEISPIDKPEQELVDILARIFARDLASCAARIGDTNLESSAEDGYDFRHRGVVEDKVVHRASARHVAVGGFESDPIR
jgi:hypothetical protein